MNKIGLHIGYFWGTSKAHDIFSMLELTHAAGLEVMELNPAWLLRLSDAECHELLRRAREHGMTLTLNGGLDPTNDISSDSEEIREAGVRYCIQVLDRMYALEMAVWSGLNYSAWLRVPEPYADIPEEKERARELSIRSLKKIMRAAEANGVDYCFEVVNRYEQFLFNTAKEAVAFAEEIASPRAKVHLDTFHMNIEEDNMFSAIAYAGESGRLGHFHAGESNRRIPGVGESHMNWDMIAKALNSAAYKGAVVMEPFVLTAAHNAKRTRVWRDLSGGTDLPRLVGEARAGGEFLRRILNENL